MSPTTPPEVSPRGAAPASPGPGAAPRSRLSLLRARRGAWKRLLLAAGTLGAGVWLWGWLSVDESGQPVTQTLDEPQAVMEGAQPFIVRRDGLPWWEISARRVTVSADGSSTLANGVGKALLYREGQPFLRLSAPSLRFSKLSGNLEATGGVSATGPSRFSFQTARALWLNAAQTVICPKPATAWLHDFYFATPSLSYEWNRGVLRCPGAVEVRTEGAVFRGKNLEATLKTRDVKLSGGVQIIFAPSAVEKVLSPRNPA